MFRKKAIFLFYNQCRFERKTTIENSQKNPGISVSRELLGDSN